MPWSVAHIFIPKQNETFHFLSEGVHLFMVKILRNNYNNDYIRQRLLCNSWPETSMNEDRLYICNTLRTSYFSIIEYNEDDERHLHAPIPIRTHIVFYCVRGLDVSCWLTTNWLDFQIVAVQHHWCIIKLLSDWNQNRNYINWEKTKPIE